MDPIKNQQSLVRKGNDVDSLRSKSTSPRDRGYTGLPSKRRIDDRIEDTTFVKRRLQASQPNRHMYQIDDLRQETRVRNKIIFYENEIAKLDTPHDDALVISLNLGGTIFSRVLVDTGGATNVLSQEAYESMGHPPALNVSEKIPFASLGGCTIQSLETILIHVKTYDLKLETKFAVVQHSVPFDAIMGRIWLHQMKVVPSTYHQCLKFISPTGPKTIHGSHKQS
ncbi:hypothetical protein Bca101_082545 [Brassica carinata]